MNIKSINMNYTRYRKPTPYHTEYVMKCRTNILTVEKQYITDSSNVIGKFENQTVANWNNLHEMVLSYICVNKFNKNYFDMKRECENGSIDANILLYKENETWSQSCQNFFWVRNETPKKIYKSIQLLKKVYKLNDCLFDNVKVEYAVSMKI